MWPFGKKVEKLAGRRDMARPVDLLRDPKAKVRREAALALGRLHDAGAIHDLVSLMDEESLRILRANMRGYGAVRTMSGASVDLGSDEQFEHIVSTNVRGAAADALRDIGKPAVPHLIRALKRNDDRFLYVRKEAARVLGEMRASDAIPALSEAAKGESDFAGVNRAAQEALEAIGGPEATSALASVRSRKS